MDALETQKEMMELIIKAGRRLLHDFNHLIDEVPSNNPVIDEFKERSKMWETIFYPDNGPKNYRSNLHLIIDRLEVELRIAQEKIKVSSHEPIQQGANSGQLQQHDVSGSLVSGETDEEYRQRNSISNVSGVGIQKF